MALRRAPLRGAAHLRHRDHRPLQPLLPRLPRLQHRDGRHVLRRRRRADARPTTLAAAARPTSPAASRCSGATATCTVEDLIGEARRIGYFHVHVYTNGTLGLDCSADLVWVSMDGLPGIYETRRGDHFAEVERNIRALPHPKTAVIYVIDRFTAARHRAVPALGARDEAAGHRRDGLLPHAVLRHRRALPDRRGARAGHRPAARAQARGAAAAQLGRRAQGAQDRRLAATHAGRARRGRRRASRCAAERPTASAPTAATAPAPSCPRRSGCVRARCWGW